VKPSIQEPGMKIELILTTDSDFYQYIKQAMPGETKSLSAPVAKGRTQ
jgi:hypothetical protein